MEFKSKSNIWGAALGLVAFLAVLALSEKIGLLHPTPVDQATVIVQRYLTSPASFKKIDGEVLWRGKDKEGRSAYVVGVAFDASNSFGTMLRGCMYVAFSETADGKLTWNESFGVQDYTNMSAVCDPNTPDAVKKPLANTLANVNFEILADEKGPPPTKGNAAQPSSAEILQEPPSFKEKELYSSLRGRLLADGWQPIKMDDADPFCGEEDQRCNGMPERRSCAGTGLAQCIYTWKKDKTLLSVFTVYETPQFQDHKVEALP